MRARALIAVAISLATVASAGCGVLPFGGGSSEAPPPASMPSTAPATSAGGTSAPSTQTPGAKSSAATGTAVPDKVTLSNKAKKGDVFTYRATASIVNNAVVNGRPQKIRMSQVMVFAYRIMAIGSNGDMSVRLTYKSASATIRGKKVALPLQGKSLNLVVSPLGEVKQVKNLSAIESTESSDYERALRDNPGTLPNHTVGVGDSWDSSATVVLPDGSGTVSIAVTYRLAALRMQRGEQIAIISSTFRSPARLTLTQSRFILDAEGTATGTGTSRFSVTKGRLLGETSAAKAVLRESFHASGLGLPFVNSTSRMSIKMSVQPLD